MEVCEGEINFSPGYVEKLRQSLTSLPKEPMALTSKYRVVCSLFDEVKALRAARVPWKQISAQLALTGFDIKPNTLRCYHQLKAKGL